MATLDSFKDVRTIASVSALVAVGVFSTYFLAELSKIKKEQEELKKHLAVLATASDPNSKKQVDQIVQAIKILDSRLVKTQEDLVLMSKQSQDVTGRGIESPAPKRATYQRLTERRGEKTPARVVELPPIQEDEIPDDFDDDIAAMRA